MPGYNYSSEENFGDGKGSTAEIRTIRKRFVTTQRWIAFFSFALLASSVVGFIRMVVNDEYEVKRQGEHIDASGQWSGVMDTMGELFDEEWFPTRPEEEFGYVCEVNSWNPFIQDTNSNEKKEAVELFDECWPGWVGPHHDEKTGMSSCYKGFRKRVSQELAVDACQNLFIKTSENQDEEYESRPTSSTSTTTTESNRRLLARPAMHPYLAHISSEEENRVVHKACGGFQSCWIGIHRSEDTQNWEFLIPLRMKLMLPENPEDNEDFVNPEDVTSGVDVAEDGSRVLNDDDRYDKNVLWFNWGKKVNDTDLTNEEFSGVIIGARPIPDAYLEYEEEEGAGLERQTEFVIHEYNQHWFSVSKDDPKQEFPFVCEWEPASLPENASSKICPEIPENIPYHYATWNFESESGSCYIQIRTKMMFTSAENACKELHSNAHLAWIDNEKENELVYRHCGNGEWPCWIGYTLNEDTNKWYWTGTDAVPAFENWEQGFPLKSNKEDKAKIHNAAVMGWDKIYFKNGYYGKRWYQVPHWLRAPFVCEIEVPKKTHCPIMWTGPYRLEDKPNKYSCFRRFMYKKTQEEARDYCRDFSLNSEIKLEKEDLPYLVQIGSEKENFIVNKVCGDTRRNHPCWIGLSRNETISDWHWDNGHVINKDVDFEHWVVKSQEEVDKEERKAEIIFYRQYNNTSKAKILDAGMMGLSYQYFKKPTYGPEWYTGPEDLSMPFVCQIDLIGEKCTEKNIKYRMEKEENKLVYPDLANSKECARQCEREQDDFFGNIGCAAWVFKEEDNHCTIWQGNDELIQEKVEGYYSGLGGCVARSEKECPTIEWGVPINGSCYRFMPKKVHHETALNYCKHEHEHAFLATISSKKENAVVHRICGGLSPCWIGLKAKSNKWRWQRANGEFSLIPKRGYTNWASVETPTIKEDNGNVFMGFHERYFEYDMYNSGWINRRTLFESNNELPQPPRLLQDQLTYTRQLDRTLENEASFDQTMYDAFHMLPDREYVTYAPDKRYNDNHIYDSLWYTTHYWSYMPFVCESPSLTQTDGCPHDWHFFEGSCYKLFSHEKSQFYDAQLKCHRAARNGHLVSIESEAENRYVRKICARGAYPCWIGLHQDNMNREKWAWTNHKEVVYTKWANSNHGVDKPQEPHVTFMGFNYAYWVNGEARQKEWQISVPNPNGMREDSIFPSKEWYATRRVIFAAINFLLVIVLRFLWLLFAKREKTGPAHFGLALALASVQLGFLFVMIFFLVVGFHYTNSQRYYHIIEDSIEMGLLAIQILLSYLVLIFAGKLRGKFKTLKAKNASERNSRGEVIGNNRHSRNNNGDVDLGSPLDFNDVNRNANQVVGVPVEETGDGVKNPDIVSGQVDNRASAAPSVPGRSTKNSNNLKPQWE